MSDKELLREHEKRSFPVKDSGHKETETRAELLSRLERGRKAIEAMEKIRGWMRGEPKEPEIAPKESLCRMTNERRSPMNLPKQESCLRWPVCKYSEEPTCPMECGHFIDTGIEQENAELRAELAEKDREIDKYKLSVKNIDEHKVLHGEPRPMCSCGYTCKTDQGMETHLKSIRIQSELKDARIKINDLQRELNKCDCGVCNWCNGSTYYHMKQRAEKTEAELAELRERLKPVEEVCKKWDKKGDRELLHRPRLLAQELWQAIKAACEKGE